MRRYFFLTAGWFFFALGMIGIFVPLLPTTPFMILAAGCFSRSSKRLYEWLLSLKGIGPLVQDWEQHQVIRPRAKVMATTLICLLVSYPLLFKDFDLGIKGLVVFTIVSVLAYIWTRPSGKRELVEKEPPRSEKGALGKSFIQFVQQKDKAEIVRTPDTVDFEPCKHVDHER